MDRKYRPKTFGEVLGQDMTKKALQRTLEKAEIEPAYLFNGPHGSGKTTLARIFARAVLCQDRPEGFEPCNKCEACTNVLNQASSAYTEINAADVTKVEDIRDILERTSYKALDGDKRIILFDESHMLSKASQNLLLKPLEDAADDVHWIFCTTERNKMLPTIQSRCQNYTITPIPTDLIVERLQYICEQEGIEYETDALRLMAEAKRHMRDILKLLEKLKIVGGAIQANVDEYLNVGLFQTYFEILLTLQDDTPKAMSLVESALDKISPQDLWRGVGVAAMDSYKAGIGVPGELPMSHTDFPKEVHEKYGDALVKISEYISTRKGLDRHLLSCELINLKQKVTNGFAVEVVAKPTVSPQSVTHTPSAQSSAPAPLPEAKVEKQAPVSGPLTKYDGLGMSPRNTLGASAEASASDVAFSPTDLKINPDEFTPLSYEAFRDMFRIE